MFSKQNTYEVLEYLESTGSQWIDTGLLPTPKTKIEVDFQSTSNAIRNGFFGGSDYTKNARFGLYSTIDMVYVKWSTANVDTDTSTPIGDTRWIASIDAANSKVVLNGAEQVLTGVNWGMLSNNTDKTIHLFAYKDYGRIIPSCSREYSAKIWEDGLLVRSFLPCRRIADGELGMYDTVTKQFFTNQGSGAFVAGPVSGERL